MILGVLLLPFSLFAQQTSYASEIEQYSEIKLDEFISLASQNPFFEAILIDQLDLQYSETLALPADDWILSVKAQYQLGGDETNLVHGFNGSVGLSKLFNESGTQLSSGFNWTPGATSQEGNANFFFNLAQPIGQNAFGRQNKWISTLTRMENSIAEIQIIEAYEDYLASLIVMYYDWYSNYSRLQNSYNSYRISQGLLEEMEAKQRYGIADALDINTTKLQLRSREDSLMNNEASYKKLENEIRMVLGMNSEWTARPVLEDYLNLETLDTSVYLDSFYEESRTAEVFELLLSTDELNEKIAAEDLLPSANLIANYGLSGAGYGFEGGSIDHSLNIGVEVNYSILSERMTARNELAKIATQKTALDNENKILNLRLEIENLVLQIKSDYERYLLAEEMLGLAELVYLDEQEDYDLGSSELNFLIQAINSRDTYEIQLITKKVALNSLIIEMLRVTDNLVVKNLQEL